MTVCPFAFKASSGQHSALPNAPDSIERDWEIFIQFARCRVRTEYGQSADRTEVNQHSDSAKLIDDFGSVRADTFDKSDVSIWKV